MSYYTEGYISSVAKRGTNATIMFRPAPPFLFEERGETFCLLKGSGGSAKLHQCDEQKQIALPELGLNISDAIALLTSYQKLRINGSSQSLETFKDWNTL